MQKFVDITLRIPVADDTDEPRGLTLASDIRQMVKENGFDLGIDEVLLVSVFVFDPEAEKKAAE